MDIFMALFKTDVFQIACISFFLTSILAGLMAKFAYRGYSKDKEFIKYSDDVDERVIRASVIWIRQDLSHAYSALITIAGLLGAILVVLIIKL